MIPWHRLCDRPAQAWVAVLLFVVLSYFPLFLHLDALPARLYDESRQALSALEMLRSGDWIVTHYDGQVDLYNTKPPLLFWLIASSYALLGPGELAMRLPVAILAWITCWVLFRTVWRVTTSPWAGLIAVLILLTCGGYVQVHVARTADFDAPMILFMFTSFALLFQWSRGGSGKLLFWGMILLALGVLTKSVQALLYVPGIALALLWEKRSGDLLRERWFYFGGGVLVLLVGGFFVVRELAAPGYVHAVLYNDVTGRVGEALDQHAAPAEFYVKLLYKSQFAPWWWLALLGGACGLVHRDATLRSWTRWLVCIAVTYLVMITVTRTKMEWYNAPLLPLLSALATIPLYLVVLVLREENVSRRFMNRRVLPATFIALCFIVPYATTFGRVYFPKEHDWDYELYAPVYALRAAVHSGEPPAADVICFPGRGQHLYFQQALLREQGHELPYRDVHELMPGMRVMFSQQVVEDAILARYHTMLIQRSEALRIVRIIGLRGEEQTPHGAAH